MTTQQKATRLCLIVLIAILMIGAAILGSVTLADNGASGADAPFAASETLSALPSASSEDISTRVGGGYTAKLTYNADIVTGVDMTDAATLANKANLAIVIPAANPTDGATPIAAIGESAFSMDTDGNKDFVFTSLDMSRATNLTTIGNNAFRSCIGFTGTLEIPCSVTSIGASAFSSCSGFTGTLEIPSSVTSIGAFAFFGCSGFTGDLTITSGVETIGEGVFEYCNGFTGALTIPDSVTSIGNSAFSNCSGFTGDLTIPGSVTSIGDSAFSNCSGFNGGLTIPSSVTSISDAAFSRCTGFTGSLTIPSSVTSIGDAAFYYCIGFTGDLTILAKVLSIGNNAFGDCTGFTGDLTIPDSVTSIGNSAFSGCSGFTGTLEIPSSVTSIGGFAFGDCTGFTGKLAIPSSVTSIGSSAFYGCAGFTGDLEIPSSVTSIEGYAFGGCTGFTGDLGIPSSVTSIGASAFSDCTALDTIYLPNNTATTYGTFAFANVTCPIVAATAEQYATYKTTGHNLVDYANLTYVITVTFGAGNGGTFAGGGESSLSQDKLYNLPLSYELDAVTKVWAQNADYALPTAQRVGYIFKGFTATAGDTVAVSADSKVTGSAYYAIYEVPMFNATFANGSYTIIGFSQAYLNSLTAEQKSNIAIVIPETYDDSTNGEFPITAIGESAFSMDIAGNKDFVFTSLDMTGATNLTTIGNKAFNGCSGFIGDLTIPSSVKNIGVRAFNGCSGFNGSLTIPNSVTSIGGSTFNGCTGFTGSLTIPNSVKSIGNSAFYNCSGFNGSLTIPNSVESIGNSAFYNCSGFNGSLTIPNSVTSIGDYAFSDCSGFTGGLIIPSSVTNIGNDAFSDCSGFNGNLTIGSNVEVIGMNVFFGCSGFIGDLTIPSSVKNIGVRAFRGCSGFNGGLIIPDGVTSIDAEAFYNCSGFTGGLIIPSSVTNIGADAFSDCSGFNGNLTIGNSVGTIGVYAFYNCSGFTGGLIIPSSVTNIGEAAFSGCTALGTIYLPNNTATTYQSDVFNQVICPIVAANEGQYTMIYATPDHNLAGYSNLTYVTTVTFSAGDGGTIVGGGESALSQDKLYSLPLSYELDAVTKIWAQNEFYTVPTAQKANCIFKGFVDNNNAMISPETTVIKQEFTASYAVLESIAATFTQGNTKVYTSTKISDLKALIASGLTVTGTYNDSSTLEIAGYTLSLSAGYAFTVGSNSVVVTFNGKTAEIAVNVTATVLESIAATNPTKTNYTAFGTFDKTGMVVTATYNDGTSKDLNASDYTIRYTGGNASFRYGDTTVTIAFTENGVEKTAIVNITVSKIQLDKPTVSGDYTYIKGTEQTVTLNGVNDDTMNITGNTATNAGIYSAAVALQDPVNYEWMDGTGGDVSLSWTIGKAKLTITPNYDTTAKVFVGGSLPVISTTQSISGAIAWDSHDLSVAVTNKAFGWTWTPTDTENYEVVTGSVNFTVTAVSLESITATFTQGQSTIYATDSLDSLKQYLTVSGLNNDGSSAGTIEDYFLSGDLTAGGSVIITVTYDGKTTTFNVTVTAVAIERISITFNQGEVEVFTSTDINNLKGLFGNALTVTIHYNNGTSVATTEFTLSGDLTQAGESISITAKLDADTTKTANFNIKVSAVALESITATFNQGTNAIYTSATLDDLKQYLTVTGINNDGTAYVGTIEYTLSGTLSAGSTNTITVTVNDKQITTTFNNVTVTAVALESITATFNQGTNAIYTSATLDRLKKYLTVTGLNNDGTDYVGTIEYTLSGTLSAGSTNTITVTVSDKQITTTFNNVTVTAVALESITATFTQGENKIYTSSTLDSLKKYLTVTGLNNDGTDYVGAIDYTLSFKSGSDFAVGSNTVIVTFNGKTAEITVTVTATVLESIAVTTVPDKAAYTAFDDFDKTGMAITATYSHGTAVITDYAIVSGTSLQAGTTTLTISYTYSSVTKTTTVDISVAKASYDLSKITFVDKTIKKNGNTHTIAIMGKLPSGVTVSYTGTNGYVADGIGAAGVYTVTATFTVDDPNNYNIPDAIVATLTINLAEITGGTEDGEDTVIIGGENGIKPGISLIITEKPTLDYKDSNIAVGDVKQTVMQAYDIKLMLGNVAIQPDDNVTVKLLINDSLRGFNELRVMYIGEDGTVTEMNAVREGDYMVFDTTLFSYIYAIVAPTSVATPIIDDGSHCWLIVIIVIAILLLLLILLLLALFLFRKNKEVGFKEYYVSLVDKVKGIFVKNKQFLGTSMESSEEGQDGTEVVAEELEAKKLEEVSETSDSESQEEGTAKAAAGKKPKKKKS